MLYVAPLRTYIILVGCERAAQLGLVAVDMSAPQAGRKPDARCSVVYGEARRPTR